MAVMMLALFVNASHVSGGKIYTLKIAIEGEGSTNPSPGIYSYEKGREVVITAEPAEGYVFYQWEIDGVKMTPHGSPVLRIRMDRDRVVKAIFIPKEGGERGAGTGGTVHLNIQVIGNGTTEPAPGRHTYSRGSIALVKAEPAEGYVFYQWEIDGRRVGRNSPLIEVVMDEDHVLKALFVKKSLVAPLKSISPNGNASLGVGGTAGATGWDFPSDYRVIAGGIDLSFNEDLLGEFGDHGNYTIYLGGPAAIPFTWRDYGVSFERCSLVVNGRRFNASFGEVDYAVILLEADGTIRIGGITRYGTRAGLMWLLQEYDFTAGESLIMVEWIDLNGNGEVDFWEISPVLEQ